MPWYEKEDLEKAREMTAIEYLKRYEPQRLKPCRGLRHEYELTDHDSFKINEITSQWHWKSRDIGGISALNFLVHVNGMSFLDAVGFLLEQNPSYIPPNIQEREMAKKPFALPERAKDVNRIWNYLKHRGISRETFVYCVNQGILYESLPYHMLWSSIFVTLMANKIGGLQFGIYRNCQISSRVFHTAVAALPLTKANRSDFE